MEKNTSPPTHQQAIQSADLPSAAAPAVAIPLTGYLRLSQIIGDPEKGLPAIIPLSKSTWWHKCKTDPAWPQPVKLSVRCTGWLAADILALVDRLANEGRKEAKEVAE